MNTSKSETSPARECAACGSPAEGNHGIHRDGLGEGPEVDLCDACGDEATPTLEQLWEMIRARRARQALETTARVS